MKRQCAPYSQMCEYQGAADKADEGEWRHRHSDASAEEERQPEKVLISNKNFHIIDLESS